MISTELRDLVRRLHGEGQSYRSIAKTVNVSPNSVKNIVFEASEKQKKKTGPKSKLKKSHLIAIKREFASITSEGAKVTARKIKTGCSLGHVTIRTVRRALSQLGFNYQTAQNEILLSAEQKARRLELAKFWIDSMWAWHKVVWTDEKRFNLDGPDFASWSQNTKKIIRNKRQQGGRSIQFWGMLLPDGRLFLRELTHRSKSSDYIELLENFAKPLLDNVLDSDYIFQQDNASIHASNETLNWLRNSGIDFMDWPARSPDLSPIENVWKLLSDLVYDGPQFKNVNDLRKAIESSVETLNTRDRYKVMTIRDSIQRRLRKVIECNGDKVNY